MRRALIFAILVALVQGGWAEAPAAAASDCSAGYIALTYDDGPIPGRTDAVLSALERSGIKATFFTIGNLVARYPEIVRKADASDTSLRITRTGTRF